MKVQNLKCKFPDVDRTWDVFCKLLPVSIVWNKSFSAELENTAAASGHSSVTGLLLWERSGLCQIRQSSFFMGHLM